MEENKESFRITWQVDTDEFKSELCTKKGTLDELNLQYDMLKAEKDVVNAKLQTVNDNLRVFANEIKHLQQCLHELHSENNRLSMSCDHSNKVIHEFN